MSESPPPAASQPQRSPSQWRRGSPGLIGAGILAGLFVLLVSALPLERRLAAASERLRRIEQRLAVLEDRAAAPRRVLAAAAPSVLFLQGSYGFTDPESGLPLRFLGFRDGRPVAGPDGQPAVTTEGDGPPVERQFTGTAFVAAPGGLLVTNRHVVRPWEHEKPAQALVRRGYIPRLRRFVGYLPGEQKPFEMTVAAVAEEHDLAVLASPRLDGRAPPLRFAQALPRPGDDVLVLGYPIGLKALLGRADEAFVDDLMHQRGMDFWGVAQRLSDEGRIDPLATRGMVGQVTPDAVVYDAQTARGGSGGPVLDLGGRVVAVNAVLLPEFLGSNMGIPAAHVRRLLEKAEEEAERQAPGP